MPEFKSSIGSKSFNANQKPLKEYEVPNGNEQVNNYSARDQYNQKQQVDNSKGRFGQEPKFEYDMSAITQFLDSESNNSENSSQSMNEEEIAQLKKEKELKAVGKERLNTGAKNRIEMLLGMTKVTKSINIGGSEFVLESISSNDKKESLMAALKATNKLEEGFEVRRQYLARSLKSIAGVDINIFLSSNKFDDKLAFIDVCDDTMVEKLFEAYLDLVDQTQAKYITKVEDFKEIVEDLKK